MSSILDLTSGTQEDVGYLEMRFRDTFVRYKPDNSCFRISYMLGNSAAGSFITKEFNEIEKRLLGREDGLCEVPFEDLDPFYMPLGYGITSGGSCVFQSRLTIRNDWRQGLRAANVSAMFYNPRYDSVIGVEFDPAAAEYSFRGEYTSLSEASSILSDWYCREVPLSRNFSLSRRQQDCDTRTIRYQTVAVGELRGDDMILTDRFSYLREAMNEEIKV